MNVKLGGDKTFGLHAIEFDRYVVDETSSALLTSFDFSGAVSLEHSTKESTKYKDIEHWNACHIAKNDCSYGLDIICKERWKLNCRLL